MFNLLRRAGTRFSTRSIVIKPSETGQPNILSHPHLGVSLLGSVCWPLLTGLLLYVVQQNELTPGIPSSDYEARRKKLMDLLPEKSVVVSVAAPAKYMSRSESSLSALGVNHKLNICRQIFCESFILCTQCY